MKKVFYLLYFAVLSINNIVCAENCFIAVEDNNVLQCEGNCETRYSPCSSFKILLSLIGYDSGILIDETNPVYAFQEEYDAWRDTWRNNQTPKSWMKESCVWYSQVLTKKLGMKKFQEYVKKCDYGNKDVSGHKGKNNGLTHSWLSSSLEISALEQVAFLEKMLTGKLPIKSHAVNMTKNILYIGELTKDSTVYKDCRYSGWRLYGKTGSGFLLNNNRSEKLEIKHGWFVGWIEKDKRRIVFAGHIIDDKKEEKHAGPRAKEQVKEKLIKLIDSIKE